MKAPQRKRLEAAGFKVGSEQEFLGLSEGEMGLIDMKVRLVTMLRTAREAKGITQTKLAKLMESSQSRVAKLEGACAEARLDLICRALFAVGVAPQEIGKAIAARRAV
jgi:hypothetical protein